MKKLKQINELRPTLKTVAPLTHWICVGFVLVNLAISFILFNVPSEVSNQGVVPVVNAVLSFDVWATWFLTLSLTMLIPLLRNSWDWLKRVLLAGLVTKLIWTYALLFLLFKGGNVLDLVILWAFLAWTQAWTIVFFVPTIADDKHTPLDGDRYS